MDIKTNKCEICGLILDINTVIVKERGLLKFIKSSYLRADGKADRFKDRAEMKLHKTCRNTYNNPKCIEAEKKRKKKETEKVSSSEFDFQNKCLFCEKDASFEFEQKQYKNPSSSRILVGRVKRLDTKNSILKACTTHNDDWSKQVLLRIDKVNILEKNARYHYSCYSKFCHSYRAAGIKRGRQQSQANENAMDQVFEFIETYEEDCQFSLLEIREALNNVILPSDAMIKYHLKQRYGDKVIITSGNPSIICFLANSLQIIQNSWYENRDSNDNLEKLRIVKMAVRSDDLEEPSLVILARSTVYNVNETKAIYCKGRNLVEPIQWYTPSGKLVEERSIKNNRVVVERRENGTLAVLIVHNIKINDAGNWTCKSGEYMETRDFIVGEKVILPEKNVSIEGDESKSIKLTCEAIGYPAPVVVWYKDKQPISDKEPPKKYVINDDHSLVIKKLNHFDTGLYRCKVRQKALSHYTEKHIHLHVLHKPIIYKPNGENEVVPSNQRYKTEEVYAILNDTKNITCSALAHPPPEYAWNRRRGSYDEPPITDPDTVVTAEDGSCSVFILRLYNESYFGEYRCSVSNSKGSEYIIYHVTKGNKPDPPDFVSLFAANYTELTFNVSCSTCIYPNQDDSMTQAPEVILGFSFQFVAVNKSYDPDWTASIIYEVDITNENNTLFAVGPLNNSTTYHVQVRSRNAAGYSDWVDVPGVVATLNNAMKAFASLLLVFAAVLFAGVF